MKGQYTMHPVPKSGKVNLLDEWREEAWAQSSHLAPKPLYSRRAVDMIAQVLSGTFPPSFFIHKYGLDGSAWDMNIINRLLLSPKNPGALKALLEACHLIRYVQNHQPTLYHELEEQLGNATKFQATLYEAYIAYRLQSPRLNYKCDATVDGIPLDGAFDFDNRKYRVECKQPFTPRSDEFDTMRRIVDKVGLELGRAGIVGGYGLAIRLPRPVKQVALAEADNLIQTAIRQLGHGRQKQAGELRSASGALIIDLLPLGVFDPGKRSTSTELIGRIEINPERHTHAITAVGSAHFSWSFSYSYDDVIDRLRDIIQKARKQHHNRGSEKLLICVDSQELDDFRFGLFQASDALIEERSQKRIRFVLNDSIVLVTRRIYTGEVVG